MTEHNEAHDPNQTPAPSTTPETASAPPVAAEAPPAVAVETAEAPQPQPVVVKATPADPHGWWWGTGRRKRAVARVRIKPGSGNYEIQITHKKRRQITEYFTEERDRNDIVAPLKATNTFGKIDIILRVNGGGYMGQAGAIVLGLSRALKRYDPTLEPTLREHGFLSRDPRRVERKKPGQRGARRKFQFSKR